jgi:hypothetical protein
MGDLHFRIIRMLCRQSVADLLRRPVLLQAVVDGLVQSRRRLEFSGLRPRTTRVSSGLRVDRPIILLPAIPFDLVIDR